MNLSDYELIPGQVANAEDPDHLGKIQVNLPIAGNVTNTQKEALEWAAPFTMTGTYQGFTKMKENSKVWIIRNKTNYSEMWYIPLPEYNPDTQALIDPYDNTDILISRNLGGDNNNVYVYYRDATGLVLKVGGSTVNVCANGDIVLDNGKAKVTVNGENVLVNTEEASADNWVVDSGQFKEVMTQVKTCLQTIVTQLSSDPYVPDVLKMVSDAEAVGSSISQLKSTTIHVATP